MELQAFEVQICAKAKTRDLEMAFLVKPHRPSLPLFLNHFRANQVGFKQVFDKKHMDVLRKQIQSLADYVLSHCFWTYAMLRNLENDRKTNLL